MSKRFWETKSLDKMTHEEWESLCDGCAQCCRLKFQDEETSEISNTSVVCGLLHIPKAECTHYEHRHELVPDCILLNPENVRKIDWLPNTCAYRLVAEGRPLEWWHPLISGSSRTVEEAGISVKGQVVSERDVHPDDLAYHTLKWVK